MSVAPAKPLTTPAPVPVVYPERDGKRMAENTQQFRWMVTLQGCLDKQYADDPNVFVAGDLLWYPREGHPKIRQAPDTLVVFGRPKGDRGSYLQWKENHIPPQVVFEVLSPNNTVVEMARKLVFYDKYQVEEYYILDPERGRMEGYLREGARLRAIEQMDGWVSPRLGIRFALANGLTVYGANNEPFFSYVELAKAYDAARAQARRSQEEARQAERRTQRLQEERDRLLSQLRALGIEPDLPNSENTPPQS
jgi:Uma2 family endonuclease